MFAKFLAISLILIAASCRTYPIIKQCDSRWSNQQFGTSSSNICKSGDLITAISMALAGIGKKYSPSVLNAWLKKNGGYVNGDKFVWGSIAPLGLSYAGKIANSNIASSLAAGDVVILNVLGGAHWVLAVGMIDKTIFVNDSQFDTIQYNLSEIVAGNSALYRLNVMAALDQVIRQISAALASS